MKNLDLTQILKDCPKGTKFYSSVYGEVRFIGIAKHAPYPIRTDKDSYTEEGTQYINQGECILFPSKEQRDWSKFKVPTPKVKVTLHPFDKVLVRCISSDEWLAELFSHYDPCNTIYPYVCVGSAYSQIIPYNKDTAYLVGTHKKCPINYEIEFSKEFKE